MESPMTAQTARAPAPPTPVLLRETLGSIAVLTLNRPDARNSLSEGLIAELHAALAEIGDDADVRAVVIAANGPAFSAGHDMKELTARRTDADRGEQHHIHREVGQRHQRRPGHRTARTQHLIAVALTQQTRRTVGAFDGDVAAAEGLGEFGKEKLLQFRHAHFRNCHVAPT